MVILTLIVNQGSIEGKGRKIKLRSSGNPRKLSHILYDIYLLEFLQEKLGILIVDAQGT